MRLYTKGTGNKSMCMGYGLVEVIEVISTYTVGRGKVTMHR
jgi:hypothetical protein